MVDKSLTINCQRLHSLFFPCYFNIVNEKKVKIKNLIAFFSHFYFHIVLWKSKMLATTSNNSRVPWKNVCRIIYLFSIIITKLSVSNATHVTLRNVDFNLNGNVSCEVTTESPSFYTATATSILQVVGEYENLISNISLYTCVSGFVFLHAYVCEFMNLS
jgi:hypothetical protein